MTLNDAHLFVRPDQIKSEFKKVVELILEVYKDFGFGQAIEFDEEHLSYVAQLCDGVRLLALNSDTKTDGKYTFEESQYEWIKKQAEKAKKELEGPLYHIARFFARLFVKF